MYVILTDKPGQFRTEITDGLEPVAAYDYLFYGQKKARFVIAELTRELKIRVVDEADPSRVNLVPTKFLKKFDSVEQARAELEHVTGFGAMDTRLVAVSIATESAREHEKA